MKAIIRSSDNAILFITANPEKHDVTGCVVVDAPGDYTAKTYLYNGSNFVEDVARLEAEMISVIKSEAELKKMAAMSAGGAKKTEYAAKERELATRNTLGGTLSAIAVALNAMTVERRALLFPYHVADAAAFGDTLDASFARTSAGMATSASVPALAAKEAKLCYDIRHATTTVAKRVLFAARSW